MLESEKPAEWLVRQKYMHVLWGFYFANNAVKHIGVLQVDAELKARTRLTIGTQILQRPNPPLLRVSPAGEQQPSKCAPWWCPHPRSMERCDGGRHRKGTQIVTHCLCLIPTVRDQTLYTAIGVRCKTHVVVAQQTAGTYIYGLQGLK